jgi:acetyl-CoA synthetase
MLISRGRSYEEIYQGFQWRIPQHYNIASDVCDRHAGDPSKIALIHELGNGTAHTYTFLQVQRFANQFANTLLHHGLKQGDRVMLLLGQHPATAIAHIACWKAGLVSVPTSVLFGADALKYRIETSGARAVVTDLANYSKVVEVRALVDDLKQVFLIDGAAQTTCHRTPRS